MKGIFTLRRRCLEALGIEVFEVNLDEFNEMADHEKIPFLVQEIKYKA